MTYSEMEKTNKLFLFLAGVSITSSLFLTYSLIMKTGDLEDDIEVLEDKLDELYQSNEENRLNTELNNALLSKLLHRDDVSESSESYSYPAFPSPPENTPEITC